MSELDVIGVLHGTDKSSAISCAWDYLRHYEQLFARWRDSEINVIEIGIAGGASLATWAQFFERARIVGIDIEPGCQQFAGGRVTVKIGSQDDATFLRAVATERPPTIVIDDGSHLAHHMAASFETLFPLLLPGGLYVMEDLAFHFEDGQVPSIMGHVFHQGDANAPIDDYLLPLIRAKLANARVPKDLPERLHAIFADIDTITLFGSAIAFHKREPRKVDEDVATFEREWPRAADRISAAQRYAAYLLKHNVHPDRAASLLREISEPRPDSRAGSASE